MRLVDLLPAVPRVIAHPILTDLRAAGYLTTYPHILGQIAQGSTVTQPAFLRLAAMTYGWMPRILRIDLTHLPAATVALQSATAANFNNFHTVSVSDIAACIRSVVGASKMLHFSNDKVFPIWDSKIESFRLGAVPNNDHMKNPANYVSFVRDVHVIRSDPQFTAFFASFQAAYSARQLAMGLPAYAISEVRAIEAAAFELA